MGYPETDDATDDGGAGQACVPFQVTITADAWPNEVSWVVNNTETEELVAKGGNDDLVPGDAYDYPVECINYRKGCYAVSIAFLCTLLCLNDSNFHYHPLLLLVYNL